MNLKQRTDLRKSRGTTYGNREVLLIKNLRVLPTRIARYYLRKSGGTDLRKSRVLPTEIAGYYLTHIAGYYLVPTKIAGYLVTTWYVPTIIAGYLGGYYLQKSRGTTYENLLFRHIWSYSERKTNKTAMNGDRKRSSVTQI